MLQFPENYFDREEKWGFTVSEVMKKNWAAQLEVLKAVIDVCDKYGLTYYMYWGSLIGTVRHQGYIPWDDDIDIAMPRDSYITFLEVAQNELPEGYDVITIYKYDDWEEGLSRVTNCRGINTDDKYMNEYHNFPLLVGLDLFPLYYIPRDSECAAEQKFLLELIGVAVGLAKNGMEGETKDQLVETLERLEELTGYKFKKNKSIRNQLMMLYDQVGQMFTEGESDYATVFPLYLEHGYKVDKKLLKPIKAKYEILDVTIPEGYDTILKQSFGNYMTPLNVKGAHDYPHYQNNMRTMCENVDINYWTELKRINIDSGDKLKKNWDKKILVHIDTSDSLSHDANFKDKMEYIINIFKENENVLLWWVPPALNFPGIQIYEKMAPTLCKEYPKVMEEMQQLPNCYFDYSGDIDRAVEDADAYYGSKGYIYDEMAKKEKPIMLLNYDIRE